MSQPFHVLDDAALAAMASPFRQKLLEALAEPDSAASLARQFDMSRQRIGYHMRELERAGCIQVAEERQQRGLTERLYQVRPLAYVTGPRTKPGLLRRRDRFSWASLLSLLASAIQDLIRLRRAADAADKRLATLALEARVRVADPVARKRFTEELLIAVDTVVAKHHDPHCTQGRNFRLVLGALPEWDDSRTQDETSKE